MSETTNWETILINKNRIEKELEKTLVINYDESKNFIYPKKLVFPKSKTMEDLASLDDAKYVNLSFPVDGDFKTVTVKEKKGIKNEDGNWVNKEEILDLKDLKEHFKSESIEIWKTVKELKENS
ncbi:MULTISPECIES: hypothetical protein [Spiroplasma]|uniref:hypothetical protein n=1 Tax=Spiroplasma TaxID=2132 RepID=UPI0018DCAC1C|nr:MULTISPECIES: hypothetical protein [Spiroplasma]MBH8622945.1 hypothetical protein [Spiroplasma sp. hyd1]UNF62016.1 hypothetical protein MNU24_00690 [Spiroplasma poulsonii]